MTRGWNLIFSGWRGLHRPQLKQTVGLEFPHRDGRYRTGGGHRFRPRFDGVIDVWNDIRPGEGTLSTPPGCGGATTFSLEATLPAFSTLPL